MLVSDELLSYYSPLERPFLEKPAVLINYENMSYSEKVSWDRHHPGWRKDPLVKDYVESIENVNFENKSRLQKLKDFLNFLEDDKIRYNKIMNKIKEFELVSSDILSVAESFGGVIVRGSGWEEEE